MGKIHQLMTCAAIGASLVAGCNGDATAPRTAEGTLRRSTAAYPTTSFTVQGFTTKNNQFYEPSTFVECGRYTFFSNTVASDTVYIGRGCVLNPSGHEAQMYNGGTIYVYAVTSSGPELMKAVMANAERHHFTNFPAGMPVMLEAVPDAGQGCSLSGFEGHPVGQSTISEVPSGYDLPRADFYC